MSICGTLAWEWGTINPETDALLLKFDEHIVDGTQILAIKRNHSISLLHARNAAPKLLTGGLGRGRGGGGSIPVWGSVGESRG